MKYIIAVLFVTLVGCATPLSEEQMLKQSAIQEICAEEDLPNDPECLKEAEELWQLVDYYQEN